MQGEPTVSASLYHESLKHIMLQAGNEILEVYHAAGDMAVFKKEDQSPLTEADQRAHQVIVAGLKALTPDIPVLSEESAVPDFNLRQQWSRYWLVDPLDGTKEFIHRNGEFTVNVALIEKGKPVAGWVYVPVISQLYYGWCDPVQAAFKEENGEVKTIKTRRLDKSRALAVVASRRHGGDTLAAMLEKAKSVFASIELKSFGSSLKICQVAEGAADWYPRLAPTSEWDTAAAQAVLEGAGGRIINEQMEALAYNQKESLLNPFFHALGSNDELWEHLLKGSQ